MRKLLFSIFAALLLCRCVPPVEEKFTDVNPDFTNPNIQRLYDLQDKGQVDSLFLYFRHKDPTFRYMSALAFASIKDSTAVDSLARLLNDPVELVRTAAAYSLGQIGHVRAEDPLVQAFEELDTVGNSRYLNAAILEAIGKCGSDKYLDALTSISSYRPADTVLLEGQAWGIYRYALRKKVTNAGTAKMLEYGTNAKYPVSVRFISANYLSRAEGIGLEKADSLIAPAFAREEDYRVKMALATALGKTKSERALNALLLQFNVEGNYRVKVNILRALYDFEYEKVKPLMLQAIRDPSTPVAITAAEYFIEEGVAEDASAYWQLAKEPNGRWQVQLPLYAAALKKMPYGFEDSRRFMNWEVKRRFENASNPYEKAAALRTLANSGWNYNYIRDAGFLSNFAVVKSASVEALAEIAKMPNFSGYFGGGGTVKKELAIYFVEAIMSGDPGMAAVAATVLREPRLNFKTNIDSLQFMENALVKFKRPQDLEAYIEVKKTLEFFKTGKTPDKVDTPKSKHPIDWKLLTEFKLGTKVLMKTKKGNITLELMPDLAPGTVANFLEMVKNKFLNGKTYHRVVPNFVAQGGCPRGDGYGSLSYTIRSELPYLHYDAEGYVGMASAGNHTECSQFFITHSPTPHLDGNYTIFAKVVEGMETVHKLDVGDIIEEVSLVEPK